MSAEVLAAGMVTSVGLSARKAAAAVRAGLSRFKESSVLDRRLHRLTMALVPTPDLPPVADALAEIPGLTSRVLRMSRLSAPALAEALSAAARPERTAVFLSLPDGHGDGPAPAGEGFLDHLALQADLAFDRRGSLVFPRGRAAFALAVDEALRRLAAGAGEVLVGGVDTFLDLALLAALDAEDRLLARGVFDGFIPGEGAAFLLLARPGTAEKRGVPALARIVAAAAADEPGHRYSEQPYRGDGLAAAFREVFAAAPGAGAVRTVVMGLQGESFSAKEWGVARIRHTPRFVADEAVVRPADCVGDTGAAAGAIASALAAIGIEEGYRAPPCLVWCASDRAPRGAVLLDAATPKGG